MSDVKVKFTGEADGAVSASHDVAHGLEQISTSMGKTLGVAALLEKGFEKMLETVKEGLKESIEAYAKEEVTLKQLTAAAGENAAAFREQAEAFKEHLGVSDDMVMHMTTLALRFGTLPSEIEPATKAILDWSAITGNDATSGMQALVRAVDFGQGKVKSLGIEFEVTGNKTDDLRHAIAALNEKFGGGAENVADSLHGRMSKTKEAVEDLEKAFGGLFDLIDRKAHISEAAGLYFKGMTLMVNSWRGGAGEGKSGEVVDPSRGGEGNLFGGEEGVNEGIHLTSDLGAVGRGALGAGVGSQGEEMLAYKRKLAQQDLDFQKSMQNAKKLQDDHFEEEREEHDTKAAIAEVERMQAGQKAEMAELDKEAKETDKIQKQQWEAEYKIHEKEQEQELALEKKHAAEMLAQGKRFRDEMATMGAEIGRAFTSTIAAALEAAINGEEFDSLGAMADLGFAIASIAATTLGTIYGSPALGQALGSGVAAIGGLVHGVRAKAWSSEQQAAGKRHEGGWIGERFHSGGWPGLGSDEQTIIAQEGERMLSRREVGNMGGPSGVERAARGGGGGSVTVQAFDSASLVEMFRGRGGRGIYDAIRAGGSALNPLFGT